MLHQWCERQAALTDHDVTATIELPVDVHLGEPAHNNIIAAFNE
jgi:hypothetical protein